MRKLEKLERAIVKAAKEVGFEPRGGYLLDAYTTFEIKPPGQFSCIFIKHYIGVGDCIVYVSNVNDLRQEEEVLFKNRNLEQEIKKWTKYIHNYPNRLKRMEMKEKLKKINEDF